MKIGMNYIQTKLNLYNHDNEELKGVTIDHPEYGARWRQLDFDVFNSDEIKELLIEEGIKLVTWGEIQDIIYKN